MRYSGCSLAYQFAAIIGGMAPLVCTALIALTGNLYSVAAFVIVIALVSLTCSYFMTETLRSGLRSDDILSSPSKEVGVQAPFQLPSGVVGHAYDDHWRRKDGRPLRVVSGH